MRAKTAVAADIWIAAFNTGIVAPGISIDPRAEHDSAFGHCGADDPSSEVLLVQLYVAADWVSDSA